jgi:hypothetical protein
MNDYDKDKLISATVAAAIAATLGMLTGAMVTMGRSTLLHSELLPHERCILGAAGVTLGLLTAVWSYIYWITRRPR